MKRFDVYLLDYSLCWWYKYCVPLAYIALKNKVYS